MTRRKLPVLADHSLSEVASARIEVASAFEAQLRTKAIDEKQPVSCRVGCASCCYHPVHLSALEGALLYRYLVSKGKWTPTFKAKVQEHANRTRDLAYEVWLLSNIPCPLLDTASRKCTAYQGRPFQCRVTFSQGDPHYCHPHRISDAGIVNKHEVTKRFHEKVSRAIKRHGLTMIIMPLSVSLLIGEKIVTGEIDIEAADLSVLKDYVEAS